MPKVDPKTGQPVTDDPDQEDSDAAGGRTAGGLRHRSPDQGAAGVKLPGQGLDDGPTAPPGARKEGEQTEGVSN